MGAVVSPQSSVIPNREFLENKLKDLEKEYVNGFSTMVYKKAEMPNFDDVFQKIIELNDFIIRNDL